MYFCTTMHPCTVTNFSITKWWQHCLGVGFPFPFFLFFYYLPRRGREGKWWGGENPRRRHGPARALPHTRTPPARPHASASWARPTVARASRDATSAAQTSLLHLHVRRLAGDNILCALRSMTRGKPPPSLRGALISRLPQGQAVRPVLTSLLSGVRCFFLSQPSTVKASSK